jgi:4-hydroxy-3-polyprenylbenzoate decarboxylase
MRNIKSLREYIEALSAIGEVQPIAREVDWNLEIGAITRRCNELGAPAPFFQRVKGIEPGFRAFGAPAGISRQPGLHLARVAISLGFEPTTPAREIVEALAAARGRPAIAPRLVPTGPCKEHKMLGDAVDLYRFPTPIPHEADGGRYINTYGLIICRTPDKSWTSWSIARIMIVDKKTMTGIVHPLQHVGQVLKTWADIGKPMPFAVALGVPPALPFVGGMPLPAHVSEDGYIGGFLGEGVEVVRCETVDLEVPATSEIIIEGHLSAADLTVEGPMGEYAGYQFRGEGRQQPTYHVSAITYRTDPILPVVVAGEPVEEDHTAWGIPAAAEALSELRAADLPVTTCWIPLESAIHWLVVAVPRNWSTKLGGIDQKTLIDRISKVVFASKATIPIPKILVVNDDVNIFDVKELVWAFATRNHPTLGQTLFEHENISPLVAFYRSSEKQTGHGPKIVYNLLPPEEWGDQLPVRSSFAHVYPKTLQAAVIANWADYGFQEA